MGFNTALLILNDGLGDLENNPKEFVEKLVMAIQEGKDKNIAVGWHCNVVKVMATAHADYSRLYFSYANAMIDLNAYQNFDKLSDGELSFLKRGLEFAKEEIAELDKKLKESGTD